MTTPRGYQFLLMTFHNQVYLLLQFILQSIPNPVPFFSFLFNLPQMTPRMPYRVSKLSPEQIDLFPFFHLIGLVYRSARRVSCRYKKRINDEDFFYVTHVGADFLSPSSSAGGCSAWHSP